MVDYLLKHGANVNAEHDSGRVPLHLAARNGYEKILELLIKNKANIDHSNGYGKTALHKAVEKSINESQQKKRIQNKH